MCILIHTRLCGRVSDKNIFTQLIFVNKITFLLACCLIVRVYHPSNKASLWSCDQHEVTWLKTNYGAFFARCMAAKLSRVVTSGRRFRIPTPKPPLTSHKKWSFPLTEEILDGKLHFLCKVVNSSLAWLLYRFVSY